MKYPEFPQLKTLELEDRDFIHGMLKKYQPEASEWTFTNLFIWRSLCEFQWSICHDWLIVLCTSKTNDPFALQPLGPSPRLEVSRTLLQWLRDEKELTQPRIERADQRLVSELEGDSGFVIEPTRDHFDYVYRTKDLIELAGSEYHSKRNHINKFLRSYPSFIYSSLNEHHANQCLELCDIWCNVHRCEEDMNLLGEWRGIREALAHIDVLNIQGCVIKIEDKVEAFTLGELLNEQTAVVHIEKANPEIPGLYAVINQKFVQNCWKNVPYINREQDLGEPGLHKAKLSYHPDHLVEKFEIRLAK